MNTPEPIRRFEGHLAESLRDGSFVRLVLSSPTPGVAPLRRVLGRLITLRGVPTLSLTLQEPTRDLTRNLPLAEVADWVRTQLDGGFRAALLETTARDWQLALPAHRPPRLAAHRARHPATPPRTHDLPRQEALDVSALDWLRELHLVDALGRPTPLRADKYHQVQRYAEILGHLVRDLRLPPGSPLQVADMGCGRGALTFAAWQLLRRQAGFDAHVVGLEARPELATEAAALAARLHLQGLTFEAGSIETAGLPQLDILIALHACNTATDAAIRRGIGQGARLILVAPCCHQELRPQLGAPDLLAPILRHGIMAERLAEWLTDGLRSLFLEHAGYRVKLIEFVPSTHTPKNLLLAALRSGPPPDPDRLRTQIQALKDFFGIGHHALDPLLAP